MSDKIKARHIVERWHLGIKKEDKTKDGMSRIFDDVASQLFCAGIEFDTAYMAMLDASKLMYPKVDLAKVLHSKVQYSISLAEYIKQWQEAIVRDALSAFYVYFKIEGDNKVALPDKTGGGAKTEDELNEEDFWSKVKLVSKDKPWLFREEEDQK